jgi:hypothetical protein
MIMLSRITKIKLELMAYEAIFATKSCWDYKELEKACCPYNEMVQDLLHIMGLRKSNPILILNQLDV